jgi:PhzF family phenazine biosynthesis protein
MRLFARWTNLSETTFLLPPTDERADYRVRIFTPMQELPFAGHPTLGTAHAWLEAGGPPARRDVIVQECPAGLITLRRTSQGLAFRAPSTLRSGPVDESTLQEVAAVLGVARSEFVDAQWADNGPGWVAVELASAEAVLAVKPGATNLKIGVFGRHPAGSPEAIEVRAFFPSGTGTTEDPVTGSLNAALAQWLLGSGKATAPYTASQGTVLGRRGRVHVTTDADGAVWIGGGTHTLISGSVLL